MAASRSKPARRMSQPSPLAQPREKEDDADEKLFLPISRSSSNLGVFQLPPPPMLNRQDSHESSSSENDPAQSPNSVASRSGTCISRSLFSLHTSTQAVSHTTSPATINTTAAAAAAGPYDASFSSVPFPNTHHAVFRTLSPPQRFSNFSQDDHVFDEVFHSQSKNIEAKNPYRPPSPYGEIAKPLSPVVMNGDQNADEKDTQVVSASQAQHKTVKSHFSLSQTATALPPFSPSPLHSTPFLNSYATPKPQTLASLAASYRAANGNTEDSSSHSNLNDKLSRIPLNNDHLLNDTRKNHLFSSLPLETPSHEGDEFTNVSLNNDFLADLSNSNDSSFTFKNRTKYQDDNCYYSYNNNNNSFEDRLSSLSFNDNINRGRANYHSFDSDRDSVSPITAISIDQSNTNHHTSSDSSGSIKTRRTSIVDGLLQDIRDRLHLHGRSDSVDSDTMTECSSTSDAPFSHHGYGVPGGGYHVSHLNRSVLQSQSSAQLKRKLMDLQRSSAQMNASLVKHLKRRDRHLARQQRNCDIVTAVLQASSLKRQIDTRMKFSLQPPPGESAFDQWRDAMKAVCRLPMGIPSEFRKKAWLSLADHYLFQLKINWEKTVRFVFNERSNPDDEQLGEQIVKDLHRTGCSNFSGEENEEDRAILKRLLLAYARWNKRVGYCQGFNVIAALLLNVMDRREDDALKVMIYLIDSVLPESYFANNLRALSVDMAVFRDLLRLTYPRLSNHLDKLQLAAQDVRTGACYEPPLPNVFTMQWFLTLFATCLPIPTVLRVWDSILLEGSEILLRTALTIWGRLAKRIMTASSADEFYCLMGELTSSIMQGTILEGDAMIKSIYGLGEFPFPQLHELREKYTYNIRPFTPASSASGNGSNQSKVRTSLRSLLHLKYNDDEDLDDDDITAMACMPGDVSGSSDISVLGPGVYGEGRGAANGGAKGSEPMERMSTDIQSLKMQYEKLKQRQQQAHIIIAAASAKKAPPPSQQHHRVKPKVAPPPLLVANIESPTAMNHLFVGKTGGSRSGGRAVDGSSANSRNRVVTDGPRISGPGQSRRHGGYSGRLSTQLQAVARAQAVSKSRRMRTGISQSLSQTRNQEEDDDDDDDISITDGGGSNNKSYPNSDDIAASVYSPDTGTEREKDSVFQKNIVQNYKGDSESVQQANDCEENVCTDRNISERTSSSRSSSVTLFNEANDKKSEPINSSVYDSHRNAFEKMSQSESISNFSTESAEEGCLSKNSNSHIMFQNTSSLSHVSDKEIANIIHDSIILSANQVFGESNIESNVNHQSHDFSTNTVSPPTTKNPAIKNQTLSGKEPLNTPVKSANTASQNIVEYHSATNANDKVHESCKQKSDSPVDSSSQTHDNELKLYTTNDADHVSGGRSYSPICNEDSGVDSSPASSPMVPDNTSFGRLAKNACLSMSFLDEEMILRVESETVETSRTPFPDPAKKSKGDKHLQNIRVTMTMGASGETAYEAQGMYDDREIVSSKHEANLDNQCDQSETERAQIHSSDHHQSTGNLNVETLDSIKAVVSKTVSDSTIISVPDDEELTPSHSSSRVDRSISMCSTDSISVLLEAVTTNSPVKEVGYIRSTSVIETVPVAETVDVAETHFIASQGETSVKSTSEENINKQTKSEEVLLGQKEKNSSKNRRKNSKGEMTERHGAKATAPTSSSTVAKPQMLGRTNLNLSQTKCVSLASMPGAQQAPARRLSQPFNPFPVKHFNTNRMKAGLKLGLYTPSTLDQLRGLKPRTTSS